MAWHASEASERGSHGSAEPGSSTPQPGQRPIGTVFDTVRGACHGETLGYHPRVAGLSRSDVEHVAYLARLGLTQAELERLEGQLNHILDQYAKLAELDTSAIPPTAQTIELENILREDIITPSLPVEAVLRNAGERVAGDFVIVPPILGGDAS